MRQNKGIIFILSSPSGGGKSSIARYLVKNCDNLHLSISVTTREKRDNEEDGKDYYYIDHETYKQMLKEDKLLESAQVYDNFYGTPKDFVMDHLNNGHNVLFDIDPQGAKSISKLHTEFSVVTIFILPPSLEELEKRMTMRGDKMEIIQKRMLKARKYASFFKDYDYLVINDDFGRTCQDILSIIKAEKLKVKNQDPAKVIPSYGL
ncbi:Guanylate kinase [Candidatus Phycorickettsia trachydisci]|uniref:Guanylate kinase n=1 Tax=Candidatus Phycorickettsia trachydisci TaxID=2115978 RepID=A0A2P1P6W2_9RICK|nr:guanylate kinase [Candidatus Phycorickettsia trachydisci]AVP87001.1 Guanylate kinase [Candidatus Phycorickettsia trachydisci]